MRARFALAFPLVSLAALAAQSAGLPRDLRGLFAHPRLFLSEERLTDLRQQHTTDATLQRFVRDVLAQARGCLDAEGLRYEKRGPRLLHVSRECLRRVQALALAWRWTGDDQFAARAVRDLREVCAFDDWNPSHFLDVAEMTHAVALAYDWLHPFLSAEDRATIRDGIVRKGLEPGRDAYRKQAWWTTSVFNWNQVCNAGLLIGALAVVDEEPELAQEILDDAVRSLPIALASYEPDGAWMEGPSYWDYATRYTAYGLDALRTALGTDYQLADRAGLRRAGSFPVQAAGPTGLFFNFADGGERARRGPSPCMFWLARTYGEAALAAAEHAVLDGGAAQPMHVVWYLAPPAAPPAFACAQLFRGKVAVAVMRSSWTDPDALFAAVKGGYNQVNHGHLDLGSFVVDALGERWALDLGSDDYNLPGYSEKKRGGRRWSYYRLASHSHNVPLIDGQNQDPLAVAELVAFSADPAHAVFDLGQAYPAATGARRGIALRGRSVLVQDEFEFDDAHAVTWGLTTRAEIAIGSDGEVVLRQDGKELLVRALQPAGATWSQSSAAQPRRQRENKGVRRLELHVPAAPGGLRIAVQLAPVWADGAAPAVDVRPLAEW